MTIHPNKLSVWLIMIGVVVMAVPAHAALQWNLKDGGDGWRDDERVAASGGTASDPGLRMYGIASVTSHPESLLEVPAYLTRNDPDNQEGLWEWNGGVGLDRSESSNNGDHATDNSGPDEMILFVFEEAVTLEHLRIGWAGYQSDMTVMAFDEEDFGVATPGFTGSGKLERLTNVSNYFDGLAYKGGSDGNGIVAAGWKLVGQPQHEDHSHQGHYADVSVNVDTPINGGASPMSSSYWLIGALNRGVGDIGDIAPHNDYVKLLALGGEVTPVVEQSSGSVPAPVTIFLFGPGILLLGAVRSRVLAA